jgi:hypothetical protein
VERTRDLYEKNGWLFLPLGEAGKGSPSLPLTPHEHLTPQQEKAVDSLRTYLQQSLGARQPEGHLSDVNLFALRVIAGLKMVEMTVGHAMSDKEMLEFDFTTRHFSKAEIFHLTC